MEISARCLAIGSLLAVQGSGHVRPAARHHGPLFRTGLDFGLMAENFSLALLALGLGNAVIGQGCQAKAIT